jgi:hypothetical protein
MRQYYLVFVDVSFGELFLALLLKRDDNQSDENVDEEERKDDEIDYVEESHFHATAWYRALVRLCRFDRMLQYAEIINEKPLIFEYLLSINKEERGTYAGQPSPVCTVKRANVAKRTLS